MSGVAGGRGGPGPVEALYRDVVLDHYRKPRNRVPLVRPDGAATAHNPVCGDQVSVEVTLEGDRIREISARTRGCSIAVAAGSVMSELIKGQLVGEVEELRRRLERIVLGQEPPPGADARLRAFAGVAPLASRHRCALLAWEALEEAVSRAQGTGACPAP